MLVSIGLGVLIIFLVLRNFSKPLKLKLDAPVFSEQAEWTLDRWDYDTSYVVVGDTLAWMTAEGATSEPLVSIYEGTIVPGSTQPGDRFKPGDTVLGVKVDIIRIIGDAFSRTKYSWILLSILLSLVSHLSRAMRWRMMFKPLGYDVKLGNAFGAVLVMYLANLAFPRLGEVLRCSILARFEKVPVNKSLGTMITERVVDVICLGGLLVLCIIFQADIFLEFYHQYMPKGQGGFLKFIILGGGAFLLIAGFFLYRIGKLPFSEKLRELFTGLWDGIKSVRQLERPWLFVGHSLFIWVMYFLMTAVCFKALAETSDITLLAALPTLFFGGIAMVAVQGGLGLYPYFVSKILLLYGATETIGYAFGWIIWTAQTALVIVAGLLAFLFLTLYNKKRL